MIIIISTLVISLVRYLLKKNGHSVGSDEGFEEGTTEETKPILEDAVVACKSSEVEQIHKNENINERGEAASFLSIQKILNSFLSENCINGAGFLALPWAFGQSGVFLSTLCLIGVVMLSNLTKTYLVESMAVAEGLADQSECLLEVIRMKDELSSSVSLTEIASSILIRNDRGASSYERWKRKITVEVSSRIMSSNLLERKGASFDEDHHNFETLALTRIFLGDKAQKFFIIFNSLGMCAMLASFVTVFASSIATVLPVLSNDDYHNYSLYVALFALILLPSLFCDFKNYFCLFETLSAFRILVIILMILTSSIANFKDNEGSNNNNTALSQSPNLHFHQPTPNFMNRNFDFTGLHITLPILVFATVLHCPVSGLSQPTTDKRHLRSIFITSLVTWGLILSLFGISVAYWALNVNQYQAYNLNWICFISTSWPNDDDENIDYLSYSFKNTFYILLIKISSFIILFFPAIDVIFAFRIKSVALGNNFMEAFCTNHSTIHHNQINYYVRNGTRIIASVIPILIALLIPNLADISDYAGIFFLLVDFAFPAIIFIRSKRIARWNNVVLPTFHGFVNSTLWAWIILLVCIGTFIAIIYCFIVQSSDMLYHSTRINNTSP